MREPASSLLKDRRVLVVEDEYMMADDLRRDLEKFGAHVVGPVARVSDALSLLGSEDTLDGMILDVNLGGEKVFPVADALRARGIRFVFSTGCDEWALPDGLQGRAALREADRLAAGGAGAVRVMPHPDGRGYAV